MIRLLFTSAMALMLFSSCRNDIVSKEKWTWDDRQWVAGDVKTFTMEAQDTSAFFALDIDLEWYTDYAFENLYVRTTTVYPSGKEVKSVVSFEMAEPDGTWTGDCSGKKCALEYTLQQKFNYPEPGTYTWSIEPYMRIDTVQGIKSLEVTCRKIKA